MDGIKAEVNYKYRVNFLDNEIDDSLETHSYFIFGFQL